MRIICILTAIMLAVTEQAQDTCSVTSPDGSLKAEISIADTITDASVLDGYVMAGSYIRPFAIDFMLTYRF